MERTKFFKKITVNGIEEVDFLDNTLVNFKIKKDVIYYRVRGEDLLAPDNIAYKAYSNERFWWIICLVNDIQNIEEDLTVGLVLKIPNILDIFDFGKRWRVR